MILSKIYLSPSPQLSLSSQIQLTPITEWDSNMWTFHWLLECLNTTNCSVMGTELLPVLLSWICLFFLYKRQRGLLAKMRYNQHLP